MEFKIFTEDHINQSINNNMAVSNYIQSVIDYGVDLLFKIGSKVKLQSSETSHLI